MLHWKKLSHLEQDKRISEALALNVDFKHTISLGIPASYLDPHVFYDKAAFLKDSPLLRCYVQNPNHIGCHTLGESESFFKGTQAIEKEVIELISTDLLRSEAHSCDGYIASGGTEANIQAVWIYRNYFKTEYKADHDQIALVSSADTHYSVVKAANLLGLRWYNIPVYDATRQIIPDELSNTIDKAVAEGKKYFIVIANMATTMFGSIDDPDLYASALDGRCLPFKMHIDAAFGGFVYPISEPDSGMNFSDPNISSFTLDAHKMLQAPYGTGIFIARKGLIDYVQTKEAAYVSGTDVTLSGSRSGTNAVAIWMILMTYGPHGWLEKINKLLYRTDWLCKQLDAVGISYYRHPKMNIVTIRSNYISKDHAKQFGLVPDSHTGVPQWYKIVVMDHVEIEHLESFIKSLSLENVSV